MSYAFTDNQFHLMCVANMSEPVSIYVADITSPFVYHRKYGVFYCPFGYHEIAMRTLLAFDLNIDNPLDVAQHLNISRDCCGEYLLKNTKGTAYKSAVSKDKVYAATPKHLTAIERRIFENVDYLFTDEI